MYLKISKKVTAEGGESQNALAVAKELLKEAGEVAATVEGSESLKPSEDETTQRMLAEKLNNILYCVFVVAEHSHLDLEESFLEQVNDRLLSLLT